MASLLGWFDDRKKQVERGAAGAVAQVNPFDNGRTWRTVMDKGRDYTPKAPASVFHQATHNGVTNVLGGAVKTGVQTVNTGNLAARQAVEGARMANAMLTRNSQAALAASRRADQNYDRFASPTSGLFKQGALFNNDPQGLREGALKPISKAVGGGILGTAATVLPVARGGSMVVKGMTAKQAIPRLAVEGAGYNTAFSAGQQLVDTGRIDGKQLATDAALGAALGPAAYLAGRGIKASIPAIKQAPQAAQRLTDTPQVSALRQTNTQLQRSFDNTRDVRQRRIINQQIAKNNEEIRKINQGGYIGRGNTPIDPKPLGSKPTPELPQKLPGNTTGSKALSSKTPPVDALRSLELPTSNPLPAQLAQKKINGSLDLPDTQANSIPKKPSQQAVEGDPVHIGSILEDDFFQKNKPRMSDNRGFIIKETKPYKDGTKDVIRVTFDPEQRKLVSYKERIINDTPPTKRAPRTLVDSQLNVMNQPDVTNRLRQGDPSVPVPRSNTITPKDLKAIDNTNKQNFTNLTNEYLGAQKAGNITAVDRARRFNEAYGDLTPEEKLQVIMSKDGMPVDIENPRARQAVTWLKGEFDEAYRYFTQDKGVRMGYQQEYFPRIYKAPGSDELVDAATYRNLTRGSGRTKGREAQAIDPDALVTQDPAEILKMYYNSLENAAAGRKYFDSLEKQGLIVAGGDTTPTRGLKPVVAEGLQDTGTIYYARPKVADQLNKLFGSHEASGFFEKSLEGARNVNSFMQSFVLSGGVPNTPLNAFGIMQLMKSSMAMHPVQGARAFMVGLSRKDATQFFEKNKDTLKMMAQEGLDVNYDYSLTPNKGLKRVAQAKNEDGIPGAIRQGWDEITNDATFGRFMPALEVLHFKNVYQGLTKKGMGEAQAKKIAGQATANFFGKNTMAKEAARNKAGVDAAGAFLFAPRFRESMLNFWEKNAKVFDPRGSFKNARSKEYRDNVKFIVAAGAVFGAMDAANKAINGVHMWDNPDGKKDKLLIPGGDKVMGLPFLPSIATVPRNAGMGAYNLATGKVGEAGKNVQSFFSIPLKTATELGANENYFGQRIVDEDSAAPERVGQMGSHLVKSTMQPWIREGLNTAGQGLPEGAKKTLGIKEKGAAETIANTLEAPLRFYDPNYFKGGSPQFKGSTASASSNKGEGSADSDEIIKAAFSSPDAQKFLRLRNDDDRKTFANENPENRKLYDQYQALKSAFGSNTQLRPDGMSEGSLSTLERFNRLTAKGKENYLRRNPTAELDVERAKYEQKLAEGNLSRVEQMKEESRLGKLAVAVKYDKDAREIGTLSKARVYDLINKDPNGKFIADQLLAYNDELLAKGLISNHPYRDKYGNVDFDPENSRGGRKGGKNPVINLGDYTKGPRVPQTASRTSQQRPRGAVYQSVQLRRSNATKSNIPTPPKITLRRGIA